jgi:hypothetical protein
MCCGDILPASLIPILELFHEFGYAGPVIVVINV